MAIIAKFREKMASFQVGEIPINNFDGLKAPLN